jgi:prenyltransferase beta subunit
VRRLLAILALGAALFAASAAAAPNPANQGRLDNTVRFLQEAQNLDGGFAGSSGGPSGQMFSAWVALALAAAGINPQDQMKPGGTDVHTYLVSHYWEQVQESECAPLLCTTTLERELMVVDASGTSPHDFGGVDLAAELIARAGEDGAFPHGPGGRPGVNDTIFAIFALAPIAEPAAQAPIQPAADWVEAAQHDNGGWHWDATSTEDEVDMTGAAIQALIAAGRRNQAVLDGLAFLRRAQNQDGGFPFIPGQSESNVASTAWATQAIWAAGENPEDWRTGSGAATEEPLDYMASLQGPDGHIRWKQSADTFGIWMTAYVAPAFAGQAWPIPAPPRAIRASTPPRQAGQGGEGFQAGKGVIAGGGGRGASLFSRPKPQSRGRTPGGARVLGDKGPAPVNHSDSRRGDNREQLDGTFGSESSAPEQAPPASSAQAGSGDSGDAVAAGALGSEGAGGGGSGGQVTGTLVGAAGATAFGAPGLRGAGAGDDQPPWVALGIGAAALLIGLLGARLERHRLEPIAGMPL